jgi:hypothetical protein
VQFGEKAARFEIKGFPSLVAVGCCASANPAVASSIAATKIDDQPNLFIAHLVTGAITQTLIAETIIYGRRKTEFVEGERANSAQD